MDNQQLFDGIFTPNGAWILREYGRALIANDLLKKAQEMGIETARLFELRYVCWTRYYQAIKFVQEHEEIL